MNSKCVCCGVELPATAAIEGIDRLEGTPGEFSVVICDGCGVGTTLPIVPECEFGRFYSSDYAPYHDAPPPTGLLVGLKRRINRYFQRRPLRTLPLNALRGAPGRALDVGCGSGDLGTLLASVGWTVSGVEPSPQAGEIARAKGLDVHEGTLATAELEPDQFDLVTFQHSLEHVYDPFANLRRAHELMRPGAQLLVTVPNFGSRQRRMFQSRWFHLDLPRHRFHYTPDGLRRVAENAGFSVERIVTSTSLIGLAGSVSYLLFGRWRFGGGPWATRAISYASLLMLPAAYLIAQFGGGDYLHMVAVKPRDD